MTETVENTDAAPAEERTPKFGPGVTVRNTENGFYGTVLMTTYDASGRATVKVESRRLGEFEWVPEKLVPVPKLGSIFHFPGEEPLVVTSEIPDEAGDFGTLRVSNLREHEQEVLGFVRLLRNHLERVEKVEQLTDPEFRMFMMRVGTKAINQRNEIEQLRTQRDGLRDALNSMHAAQDRLVEEAHEMANDKDWCDEFDDFMERHGLPRRKKDWEVVITVQVDVTMTVTAESDEEAQDLAEEQFDQDQWTYVRDGYISDRQAGEPEEA